MGYQSSGCIRIVAPIRRMVYHLGRMKLESPDPAKLEEVMKDFVLNRYGPDKLVLALSYEGWKWYPSYPDVAMIESVWNYFREANTEEDPIDGVFIRIGEADDDTQAEFFGENPWELASVVRTYEAVIVDPSINLLIDNRLSTIDCSDPQGDSNADHELVPLETSGLREVQVPGLVEARPEDPGAGAPVATGED